MKRTERFLHRWTARRDIHVQALLVLGLAFATGALLGLLAASLIGQESCESLERFLRSYVYLTPTTPATWGGYLRTLWYFARLPLLLLLIGFSALGVLVIPVALLWKGFSFSFAVSALVLLYGVPGLVVAAVCFGLADLVFVPVLFWVGGWNWELSCHLAFGRSMGGQWPAARVAIPALGTVLLALSAAVFGSVRMMTLLPQFVTRL